MTLSPSPHEDMDVHYVYEPSHTGNMLNLLTRLPVQPLGLDPADDVKNLPQHLYLRRLPMIPSEDQFLYFYHVCLLYFFLLCSLFLSFKTSILWELKFYDVCDFHLKAIKSIYELNFSKLITPDDIVSRLLWPFCENPQSCTYI